MNTTATTLKEDNILIAEFMGMKQGKSNETRWKKDWFEILTVSGNIFESGRRHEYLHFDTSWDWLMPVIKKIDSYANEEMTFAEFDDYRTSQWRMIDNPSKYGIEQVHKQVVQFIEWYNAKN